MRAAKEARISLAFILVCALVAMIVPFHSAGAVDGAWAPQVSGVTDILRSAAFVDGSKGFAAGANGTILQTIDGGATWNRQYACVSGAACTEASADKVLDTFNGVSALNANEAYVVGANATIIKTTNAGATWGVKQLACQLSPCTAQSPNLLPSSAILNGVHYFGANKAIAVGSPIPIQAGLPPQEGTIITTTDGTNWLRRTSGTDKNLNAVWMADANVGYAVGETGTILKTSNAGATWTPQSACNQAGAACMQGSPDRINEQLLGVHFTSASVGYIVGANGTILTTTDGGTTWTKRTSNTTQVLNDVRFTGAEGYAVGAGGTILTSTDSGATWTQMYACVATDPCLENSSDRVSQSINGLAVPAAKTGNAVGDGGTVLRLGATTNPSPAPTAGGLVWSPQVSSVTTLLRSTWPVDADKGYAVGSDGVILRTSDGGTTWERLFACTSGAACSATSADRITTALNAVSFVDANNGLAVGDSGLILRTTDAGGTWTPRYACQLTNPCQENSSDRITTSLNGVHNTAANAVTIVGAGGRILKSADGGSAWSLQNGAGVSQNLNNVWFADDQNGVAVGDQGTVLKTTNGGSAWSAQHACATSANCTSTSSDRINDALFGVMLTNSSNGFVSGGNGVVLTTANGGTQWTKQVTGVTQALNDIHFVGSTGYAVGGAGTILTSSNGGAAWTAQFACVTTNPCTATSADRILQTLHGVAIAPNGLGNSVGADGVILRLAEGPSASPSPSPSESPSPSPNPEPEQVETFITIKYVKNKALFKGDVAASEATCWKSRRVLVKRVKKGPDKTVARVNSNSKGTWKAKGFGKKKVRGKTFYAKAPKKVTEAFICKPRASQKLKF
jgi:photosystem II stability/assembly factor-like uncharacterized protein